ncbi:MAG: helix-turn-helix domain-containing protein [Steroidobacteraceae bacterium]
MTPDRIKRIRARLDLSQPAFADLLGVSVATVRDWEQGRNAPSGPAAKLLDLAARGVLKPEK